VRHHCRRRSRPMPARRRAYPSGLSSGRSTCAGYRSGSLRCVPHRPGGGQRYRRRLGGSPQLGVGAKTCLREPICTLVSLPCPHGPRPARRSILRSIFRSIKKIEHFKQKCFILRGKMRPQLLSTESVPYALLFAPARVHDRVVGPGMRVTNSAFESLFDVRASARRRLR